MPLTLYVRDCLAVSGLSSKEETALKRALTLRNPKFEQAVRHSGLEPWQIRNIEQEIKLYTHKNDTLCIPRGFNITEAHKIIDQRNFAPFKQSLPSYKVTPMPEQAKALAKFGAEFKQRPSGSFLNVLEVSAGKTIMSAMMACMTGQRTIVFVHTQLIMKAWVRDLCRLFGESYKKEIGIIQGPKALVGPHFTIAMCQTWTRRTEMWDKWWKLFGCMIFDECHCCPTPYFKDIANKSPAAYRIGITGTPKRRDGLHEMMYLIFGTPFYRMRQKGIETALSMPVEHVHVLETPTVLHRIKKSVKTGRNTQKTIELMPDENRDYKEVIKQLCSNKTRNLLIAKHVVASLLADRNNSVLVATHRISHATYLRDLISSMWSGHVALLTGQEKRIDITEDEIALVERRTRCAVATLQLIKVGASIPPLNRLFITTTIGGSMDLEQLIGRMRRKSPGKKNVIVHHVLDSGIAMCFRHYKKYAIPYYRDVLKIPAYKRLFIS